MAKIDCSVTISFLREHERMCKSPSCGGGCPVSRLAREDSTSCGYYLRKHPEFAVEIVQAWSDEHPQKTRLDDLLEKYPNTPLREDGLLDFLPTRLGYCKDCRSCRYFEKICSEVCWNEPVDDGATGKAVE